MNSFHGTMNSFHGGMNSGTRWNEFIPGGMNSFYSRNPYTEYANLVVIFTDVYLIHVDIP